MNTMSVLALLPEAQKQNDFPALSRKLHISYKLSVQVLKVAFGAQCRG